VEFPVEIAHKIPPDTAPLESSKSTFWEERYRATNAGTTQSLINALKAGSSTATGATVSLLRRSTRVLLTGI
jgi:hypothetical protein